MALDFFQHVVTLIYEGHGRRPATVLRKNATFHCLVTQSSPSSRLLW
jgi:hypothetical protein